MKFGEIEVVNKFSVGVGAGTGTGTGAGKDAGGDVLKVSVKKRGRVGVRGGKSPPSSAAVVGDGVDDVALGDGLGDELVGVDAGVDVGKTSPPESGGAVEVKCDDSVGGLPSDVERLRELYGDLDGEIGKVLSGSGDVDERAELLLMRSFAVRLFRGVGAKFNGDDFVLYMKKVLGLSDREARDVWHKINGFGGDFLRGYIEYTYPDSKVIAVLLRVFSEIRSLTKQIVERGLRYRKMVRHEAVGEFMVDMQREVESRMIGCGVPPEQVGAFRQWYADYCANFVAKNVKQV